MSFWNVQTGDIIQVDMPYGAPPRTVTLTVASMTAKRFVAKGPGLAGRSSCLPGAPDDSAPLAGETSPTFWRHEKAPGGGRALNRWPARSRQVGPWREGYTASTN